MIQSKFCISLSTMFIFIVAIVKMYAYDSADPKIRLPNAVNSYQPAIVPVCDFDETILFFDRKFYFDNTGGTRDCDEIWFSRTVSGNILNTAEPQRFPNPLNTRQSDVLFYVNPTGNVALISGKYLSDGTKDPGYSLIRKDAEGRWNLPEPLNIRNYCNDSTIYSATLSPDMQFMILSVALPKGYGGMDLYFSAFDKDNNSWSEPQNLGIIVNTDFDEVSPCIAADNRTLYFASNSGQAFGGFDVFMTKRLDDSWASWSEPQNLGAVINTVHDDNNFWITSDGTSAYMVSYDREISRQGIYKVMVPDKFRPKDFAYIRGAILLNNGNKTTPLGGITAKIALVKENSTDTLFFFSDGVTAEFIIPVASAGNYTIETKIPGYSAQKAFVCIPKNSDQVIFLQDILIPEVQKTIEKNTDAVVETKNLGTILFDFNSDTLTDEARARLDKIADEIRSSRVSAVMVSGYTDFDGTEKFNKNLSERRAKTVAEYLKGNCKNLDADYTGYGKNMLKYTEPEKQYLNRRVEIEVK